jgi:hypothetical protein
MKHASTTAAWVASATMVPSPPTLMTATTLIATAVARRQTPGPRAGHQDSEHDRDGGQP